MGIADRIRDAMINAGLSDEQALSQIYLIDRPGLLLESHKSGSSFQHSQFQAPYAKKDSQFEDMKEDGKVDLLSVIKSVKPEVLIGCSAQHGSFTEQIIKEMYKHQERPIVLPLSNPTRLLEAVPSDINTWTEGKALIATGSPFRPVSHNGKEYIIGESNNALVFPGIGYGTVLARAKRLSDTMIIAAVNALATRSLAQNDPDQALLPDMKDVRETSTYVAAAVIKAAVEESLATHDDIPKGDDEELRQWVIKHMWKPEYRTLKKVDLKTSDRSERGETGIGAVRHVGE